ncbi:hypothetical protein NE857_32985 [Nocardiopsis exhalans]|uniref:DUF6879 domain-containing protein n=1 Tax=Nocardiopsis exhalans TaxID=163604 RepID=A0ABY5DAF8_9ACTN|nr:DUF6879 family protein [Nocardiopsis exhalans]USY19985.1 hypothetical protein NE857_32985 [Nocardiopsis exhalans]
MSSLSDAGFDDLFDEAAKSVFRLETLPVYNPVSEAAKLAAYLAGDPCPRVGVTTPYMREVTEQTRQGIRRFRVHVVHSPLNDYLRYEMEWGYVFNSQAGEEIFILDTAEKGRPDGLVDEDFWFFDDTHVVRMNYRDDGEYLGKELVDVPDLEHYRAQRDLAMAQAVPFNEYWRAHPQYHRG